MPEKSQRLEFILDLDNGNRVCARGFRRWRPTGHRDIHPSQARSLSIYYLEWINIQSLCKNITRLVG